MIAKPTLNWSKNICDRWTSHPLQCLRTKPMNSITKYPLLFITKCWGKTSNTAPASLKIWSVILPPPRTKHWNLPAIMLIFRTASKFLNLDAAGALSPYGWRNTSPRLRLLRYPILIRKGNTSWDRQRKESCPTSRLSPRM